MNPVKPSLESINKKPDTSTGAFSSLGFAGFLDVFVHQARDVHNICIYHKQDVYAKLCLTSDPDAAVSTQIVNGGGQNPVFNENLRLGVRTIESSLKCEIWMLSKVKNYLEDQLLGFALVALADVLVADGKLVHEFPLSSTDLFHSPAGFIQLSLSYVGALPDVVALAVVPKSMVPEASLPDAENEDEIPCEYQKIEFPDLRVVNENRMMVSELFGIQCTTMETQNSESLNTSESGNWSNEEAGVRLVESFSAANSQDSIDIPVSSCSAMGSHIMLPATSSAISHVLSAMASPSPEVRDGAADSSPQLQNTMVKPVISVNIEPEQTVVQQDIVDMYMKSMQQFTESLANMKLPMDVDDTSSSAQNGNDKKVPASKGTGSKVFYGSRAFF
ncbi:uncharacterized protein LOC135635488 [Musa acuminata AAA Group]|uniref:uncharacterized protein LOC135635488 n=1 Tax=Musa acuminata AAA Group TaxID=214697 RepID=UPI0031DFCF8A